MLRIGDKIVCIKDSKIINTVTFGKVYTIIRIYNYISHDSTLYTIIDDGITETTFEKDSKYSSYFVPLRKIRRQKLEEIYAKNS